MKITRRNLLQNCNCTPNSLVRVCNSILVLLATILCAMVIYETYVLEKKFINILDTSSSDYDLSTDILSDIEPIPYWKQVTGSISVFSAFYDDSSKENPFITIIGTCMDDEILTNDLRCVIKYEEAEIAMISVSYIMTNGDSNTFSDIKTILYICKVEQDTIPEKVALVSLENLSLKQWMKVELTNTIPKPGHIPQNMAACVKPLHGHNIDVAHLAEFIAMYEILGVQKFVFYDFEAPKEVFEFLQQLIRVGYVIQILPWNLNDLTDGHSMLDSTHFQDCVYRTRNYAYSLVIGIDEFIIPAKHWSMTDMLSDLEGVGYKWTSFDIKRSNFCLDTQPSVFYNEILVTQKNMFRQENVTSFEKKVIVNPSAIVKHNNHPVEEHNTLLSLVVKDDEAVIHLYTKDLCENNAVLDLSSRRYNKFLKQSMTIRIWESQFCSQ